MKILILHNSYQLRGGEDTVVEAEAALLRSGGHQVWLEQVSNDDISSPIDKVRTFLDAPYSRSSRDWAAKLVRDTRADIVHVHNFFPVLTPSVYEGARDAGAAVIQTLHNYRMLCANALLLRNGSVCEKCVSGSNIWGVAHRCYRNSALASLAVTRMQSRVRRHRSWEHVDCFIALTESARNTFIAGGLPAERIAIKPNFVTPPLPTPRVPRRGGIYIGRLSAEKGVGILLEAWRSLPDHPLAIIGDGPERAALEAVAPANVRFLGHLTGHSLMLERASASLLFVPSIWKETFGMVAIEAFASGLPVVASRIGALPDLVTDGVTGKLVRPGSAEELASAARHLLDNPNALFHMGQAAEAHYLTHFTPEANLPTLEAIYLRASKDRKDSQVKT